MRLLFVAIFFFRASFILMRGQVPIIKCEVNNFNENHNLHSKSIFDMIIDELGQVWVTSNGKVQYFNGNAFNDPLPIDFNVALLSKIKSDTFFMLANNEGNSNMILQPQNRSLKPLGKLKKNDILGWEFQSTRFTILKVCKSGDSLRLLLKTSSSPGSFTASNSNYYLKKDRKYFEYNIAHDKINTYDISELNYVCDDYLIYLYHKEVYFYNKTTGVKIKINFDFKDLITPTLVSCVKNGEGYILSCGKYVVGLNRNLEVITEYRNLNGDFLIQGGNIRKLILDKFGNIYAATQMEGLLKINTNSLQLKTFVFKENQTSKGVFSKCVLPDKSGNRVLIGTWEHGLLVFDTMATFNQRIVDFPLRKKPPIIAHISKIDNDDYLIFTGIDSLVYQLKFDNSKPRLSVFDHTIKSKFISDEVFIDTNNSIICNENDMLLLQRKPKIKIKYLPSYDYPHSVHFQKNKIFVSTHDGFVVQDDKKMELIEYVKGIHYGTTKFLKLDNDQMIVGGSEGLKIINANTHKIRPFGPIPHYVYSMIYDNKNKLWLGTNKGIFCIDQMQVKYHLKPNMGLQDWEFNTNCVAKANDGELYFGGLYGVNSFKPENINLNTEFEYYVDGLTGPINRDQKIVDGEIIKIPYGNHLCKIHLYVNGKFEPYFYNKQFLIENINTTWIDLGSEANLQQVFQPGRYKIYFHVDTKFDPNAPRKRYIVIDVYKPLYMRSWFWISIISLVAIGVIYVSRQINKLQLARSKAETQSKVNINIERNRMAKELHDHIGAQLSILSRNLSWMVDQKESLKPSEMVDKLSQLNNLTSKTTNDLRDTIWATKKEEISLEELVERLKGYTYNIQAQYMTFYFNISIGDQMLTAYEAVNLLRICQEVINNALKYSSSKSMTIDILNHEAMIKIVLQDEGVGFDINREKNKGNGLTNIFDRAKDIGYEIEIKSELGKGCITSITKINKNEKRVN